MTDGYAHPDESNWVKDAATLPRLALLVALFGFGTALFALREAVTWPQPIPESLSDEERAKERHTREVPDKRYRGYSPGELRAYFKAIGPRGRDLYVNTQTTLDLVFPFVYGAFFVGVLAHVIGRRSLWVWLPALMTCADLAENALLVWLARDNFELAPSGMWEAQATVASSCTVAKWGLLVLSAAVAVAFLLPRVPNALRDLRAWWKAF